MLRRLYNWVIDKASHRHAQWWLAAFAFVEASFFPVPPHPVLGLMCLAEPKKAVRFAVIATVASVAGGFLGYAIGWGLYDLVGAQLIHLLGLEESFPRAVCFLRESPGEVFLAFFAKGVTPIPFKLLTITSGFVHLPLWLFFVASLASRSLSFMIVGVLFRLFGAPIKRFIDRYLVWVTAAFVVLVIGGFVIATQLEGGSDGARDKCAATASAPA